MPFRLGGWEIALILVIVLVIFGAGKLPQVGNALGKSIREFRKAKTEDDASISAASSKSKVEAGVVQSSAVKPQDSKNS